MLGELKEKQNQIIAKQNEDIEVNQFVLISNSKCPIEAITIIKLLQNRLCELVVQSHQPNRAKEFKNYWRKVKEKLLRLLDLRVEYN